MSTRREAAVTSPGGGGGSGGGGYQVDPAQLMRARDTLKELHKRTVAILNLAADANPEWYIWGVVGAPFACWYWASADEMYQHLTLMGEALDSTVHALGSTAEAYQGAEKAMDDALKAIGKQLDSKGLPW
jgi:hypothetical protein